MGFPVLALTQDWLFKRCRQAQYMRPDITRVSDTSIIFLTWFSVWLGLTGSNCSEAGRKLAMTPRDRAMKSKAPF